MAERCGSQARAPQTDCARRLSVVPGTKGELERETGLEPATLSL